MPDEAATRLVVVDTDVHHNFRTRSDLIPYMSRFDGERFLDYGFGISGGVFGFNGGHNGLRVDIVDPDNPPPAEIGPTASDPDDTVRRLLDGCGIDIGLLTGGPGALASAMPDADFSNAICRAFNDFSVEHWLERDSRFRLALHVNMQDPAAAAAEIDRLGGHPAVCAIMLGCGSLRPYGHRMYHPVYEACVRNNLAVAMHFDAEGAGVNPPLTAAGYPSHYIEGRQLRPSYYIVHINSFVFEGVFKKFPELRIGILEAGFAWLPSMLWKLDLDWKGLRWQTPWVDELPSEIIKRHFRFATQPMEEPSEPEALQHILKWIDAENTLMFATDYPHFDWDDPARTFAGYSDGFRRRVFSENAIDTFRLKLEAPAPILEE